VTELKFNGPATITGFPRDKAFSVDFDGEAFVLKAGKDIWLRVEREPAEQQVQAFIPQVQPIIGDAEPQGLPHGAQTNAVPIPEQIEQHSGKETAEKKERKPRGPNVKIDEASIIQIDPNRENPYRGLRGKYYETLKTAQGRTVGWWAGTSMVKSLEGSPATLLKFFISEGVVALIPPTAELAAATEAVPTQPAGFAQGQQAPIPGALWTPPGGPVVPGNTGGGAKFM